MRERDRERMREKHFYTNLLYAESSLKHIHKIQHNRGLTIYCDRYKSSAAINPLCTGRVWRDS